MEALGGGAVSRAFLLWVILSCPCVSFTTRGEGCYYTHPTEEALKLREVGLLARSHTATEGQGQDSSRARFAASAT